MYLVGEVKNRGTLGEFAYLSLGGEDIDLILVEVVAQAVHHLHVITCLKGGTDGREPFVHAASGIDALVTPVGSKAMLRNLVHSLRAYLHLYPFVLRTQNRYMERLVAVALRNGEPVTEPLGIGLVHVGDDAVGLPAVHLLVFRRRVKDDADSKEVIDTLEGAALLLHLLIDGVNGLGPALDVELQPRILKALPDGAYEAVDVTVTRLFGGGELFLDMIVRLRREVLEGKILKLALDGVESQLVCKGRIEIACLCRHLLPRLKVAGIAYGPHDNEPVGNHDEDDAHILGEGEQEVPEM